LANWEWITYGTTSKEIIQSPTPQGEINYMDQSKTKVLEFQPSELTSISALEPKSVNEHDTRSDSGLLKFH